MERDRRRNPLHLEDDEARDLQRLRSTLPRPRDEISGLICSAERLRHFERRGFLDESTDWRATLAQYALTAYAGQGREQKKLHLTGVGENALRAYHRAQARTQAVTTTRETSMKATITIRRDAGGADEEHGADLTAGGGTLNIHFGEEVNIGARDVALIDAADVRAVLAEAE